MKFSSNNFTFTATHLPCDVEVVLLEVWKQLEELIHRAEKGKGICVYQTHFRDHTNGRILSRVGLLVQYKFVELLSFTYRAVSLGYLLINCTYFECVDLYFWFESGYTISMASP